MHGLYLLWWVQEKEMSPALVAAILAAGDITLMCLELPTGWFADRVGHRASLITGSIVQVAAMLWCWLGDGFVSLVGASVLVALSDAFRSGADQALMYRTCCALDREEAFQSIEARANAVELGALVGLVLAGGVIVETWGFAAGWLAETILCSLGVVLACAMVEPPRVDEAGEGRAASTRPAGIFSKRIAFLIVPAGLLGAMASAGAFIAQTGGDSDAARMTVLVALITLSEAFGAALASRLPHGGVRVQLLLATLGAGLFAVSLARPAAFQPIVLALAFLMGIAEPLRAAAIQRLASDAVRARAASLASACDMAFMTIALPLSGFWRRH
jgi:MFS family permease